MERFIYYFSNAPNAIYERCFTNSDLLSFMAATLLWVFIVAGSITLFVYGIRYLLNKSTP